MWQWKPEILLNIYFSSRIKLITNHFKSLLSCVPSHSVFVTVTIFCNVGYSCAALLRARLAARDAQLLVVYLCGKFLLISRGRCVRHWEGGAFLACMLTCTPRTLNKLRVHVNLHFACKELMSHQLSHKCSVPTQMVLQLLVKAKMLVELP